MYGNTAIKEEWSVGICGLLSACTREDLLNGGVDV
jgi:hypothetical protein